MNSQWSWVQFFVFLILTILATMIVVSRLLILFG